MLQEIVQLLAAFKSPSVNSDTMVSKMVYRFLLWLLLGCFLCVTFLAKNNGKMYCYTDSAARLQYATEYCLSQGVYLFANPTEEDRAHSKYKTNSFQSSAERQPINKPFPGFRPTINGKPTKLYTFFYLYIQPYFIVMAATCHIGRLLWRQLQGPLLLDIMGNLKRKKATRSQDRNDLRPSLDIEDAAHVLFQSVGQHNCFMLKYIVCQGINTLMVALHLVIITFIGGTNFWINGVKIFYYINVPYSEWPMEVAQKFPMVAKCDLRSYGPSGNEQVFDALCFMHFNHLVQFMFVIHWIASIITFLACLFSIYQLIRKLYCRHSRVQEILSVCIHIRGQILASSFIDSHLERVL